MSKPGVKTVTQKTIAGGHRARHSAVPLPIARAIPVGPSGRLLRLKAEHGHRITRGVSPSANAIPGLNQIGMWIEAGVHQRDGYAFSGESWIGVHAQAGRQNS